MTMMMLASRSMLKAMPVAKAAQNSQKMVSIQRLHRRTFFWGGSNGKNRNYQKSRGSFFSTTRDPGLEVTSVVSDPKEVEGPRGVPSRAEQIRRLQSKTIRSDGRFDVLVVGGGATGAGIAMDAAQRGLQTACIERGDFASETSSRSTKLIWVSHRIRTLFLIASLSDLLCLPGWHQVHGNRYVYSVVAQDIFCSNCDGTRLYFGNEDGLSLPSRTTFHDGQKQTLV
jgi:hypothetical protein